MALGQSGTIGGEHERYMGVARDRQTEQPVQFDLPWCRGQQIVAADHFGDALGGIVDDHGEVVRGHPVVALQHDIVGTSGLRTTDPVVERHGPAVTEQPQRRTPTGTTMCLTPTVAQVAAGARIPALGIGPLRCLGRQADLASGAVALVHEAVGTQTVDGISVQPETLRLAHDVAIPIDADAAQRGELIGLVLQRRRHPIEVFHAHDEATTGAPGHQPGHQRRPEVAEVQRTGGRWGKATAHRPILASRQLHRLQDRWIGPQAATSNDR